MFPTGMLSVLDSSYLKFIILLSWLSPQLLLGSGGTGVGVGGAKYGTAIGCPSLEFCG